ncbi:hypothetical protein [Streptomyces parvulus]|uniref:hypothetical protein n=1 Tax=Streptomyces parvulus TaxID=146923 RepID=UPI003815B5D2
MSTSLMLHCNTVRGYSSCATTLMTDGLDVHEARKIGAAHGWRHTSGKDYCPACSGSRVKPRVIIAVDGEPVAPTAGRADYRLQAASALLLAHTNRATGGLWTPGRSPVTMRNLPGVEFVTGGDHGADCVARTGPSGNAQAAADAAYIALLDPEVGRAVCAVLDETKESVAQEHGLVETSTAQAAVDLADALLRPKGER